MSIIIRKKSYNQNPRMSSAIYVGRQGGGRLGNPFVIGRDGDRQQVCLKYRLLLWEHIKAAQAATPTKDVAAIIKTLFSIGDGSILVCHCVNKRMTHRSKNTLTCHAESLVLASYWVKDNFHCCVYCSRLTPRSASELATKVTCEKCASEWSKIVEEREQLREQQLKENTLYQGQDDA